MLKDRLKEFIKSQGLTIAGFESAVGLSNGSVSRTNDNMRNRTVEAIISKFPMLNRTWLLTGEGEMLRTSRPLPHDEIVEVSDDERERLFADIAAGKVSVVNLVPVNNLDVRGGFGTTLEMGSEYVQEFIPWPNSRPGDFAVVVSGESMSPNIAPGSLVLLRAVDDWRVYLEMNALYVVELEDSRRLLKVVRASSDADDRFTLHSYNPDTPDQDLPKHFIRRIYKVIAHMASFGY